ncbi:hypothetical protein F53441_5366 [Fusarium austroafricanum]|uniref:Uncharacterized protein n=1 Tax=Fusarium austroafricanum TaxID=2364996 RepID=A0A8H4KI91_9HYPO|nr:hypothetical protein F53441_5366 [Fusarium austroafricanum]
MSQIQPTAGSSNSNTSDIEQLKTREKVLRVQLALVRVAIAEEERDAYIAQRQAIPEGSENPDILPHRQNISPTQDMRITKTSLLTGEEGAYDRRFWENRWEQHPPPFNQCFSIELCHFAVENASAHPEDEFPIFHLQHLDDPGCMLGQPCKKWDLIGYHDYTEPEGSIQLQIVCINTMYVKSGISSIQYSTPFYEYQGSIPNAPCRLANDMKPDFSKVHEAGYHVAAWRLIERKGCNTWCKWLDQFGRFLFCGRILAGQ